MVLKKGFMVIACSFFLISCGTGSGTTNPRGEMQPEELNITLVSDRNDSKELNNTTTVEEEVVEVNATEVSSEENLTVDINTSTPVEAVQPEENLSIESNNSIVNIEENQSIVEDINYSDEELTLSAYDRYITNNSSDLSAKIVSLLFKGALPVEDGIAIIKENEKFSFKLIWQKPQYAENVNFYFFNGRQRGVQYMTAPTEEGSNSYESSCEVLPNYHFKCRGLILDESKNYEGRTFPVNTSFVMAVCDRNTRDKNRICDYIRIPIQLQK